MLRWRLCTDGTPKLGWHDTLAYLTIPVILILTQSVSMRIMQPPQDPNAPEDPAAATTKQVNGSRIGSPALTGGRMKYCAVWTR